MMGKWLLLVGGLLGLGLAGAAETPAAPAPAAAVGKAALPLAQVPLRRVKLYTSGAGFFEHQGKVKDSAGLTLIFEDDQMNSLLKTFVARDFDGGSVDDVSYPAPAALEEVLGAFSIDVSEISSRYQLLERLRGERVRFFPADGGAEYVATVLGVETLASQSHLPIESVNILRDNGEVAGVNLSAIRHFAPENPALVKELGQALAALAAARNDARRPFSLTFNGKGERRVAFGYVLDMPKWKPTYRLTVGEDGKSAFLQGWALVENRTDTDWEGLQLSLVAGSPNKLFVPLYRSLDALGDDGEDDGDDDDAEDEALEEAESPEEDDGAWAEKGPARFNAASSQRQVNAREMGEMFAYDVATPVTLARRQATMLEIVTGNLAAEKVLYYDAAAPAPSPDNALFLKNDTGKVMLAGPVAVFDEGYGGDAMLEHLPQGGEALVRYGRALDVKAEAHPGARDAAYTAVKFARGVLEAQRRVVSRVRYVFRNPGNKARVLLLDVPQAPGWTLADGLKPWKDANHRDTFRVALPAGKDTEFAYERYRVAKETFALTSSREWGRVVKICAQDGVLTAAQKAAWRQAEELHAKVEALEKRLVDDEKGLEELAENQERTRKNLLGLTDNQSDFYRRLVARLADEIKQTDARQQEIKQRRAELRAAEQAFADYLKNLEL